MATTNSRKVWFLLCKLRSVARNFVRLKEQVLQMLSDDQRRKGLNVLTRPAGPGAIYDPICNDLLPFENDTWVCGMQKSMALHTHKRNWYFLVIYLLPIIDSSQGFSSLSNITLTLGLRFPKGIYIWAILASGTCLVLDWRAKTELIRNGTNK